MRPRSLETLEDYLDQSFSWRKAELVEVGLTLRLSRGTSAESTLARLGIALACAHWEGFVRDAAQGYLSFVDSRGLTFEQLQTNLRAIALRGRVMAAGRTRKIRHHLELAEFVVKRIGSVPRFDWKAEIDTESNLSSTVLRDILDTIGLAYLAHYELRANFIDRAVLSRRHRVVHGEREPADADDYANVHSGIASLMETFRNQITDAATSNLFMDS
ncbi:MAG TPA: MAE_28990/MAE_18760 family HEPN-like nuclease [Candidatus Solibacter sp.]|nr:MAE_28990/MAE_18760 family HEPN-like nuclease [Candidatus Solibacter sp.]